jgi:DNA-directed RNA polymerase sigma subunit (sigma70/sigma32)
MGIEELGKDVGLNILAIITGKNILLSAFNDLTIREQRVLMLRYGLLPNRKVHTFREIGEIIGRVRNPQKTISSTRARQITCKALRRIKKYLNKG